MEDDGFLLLRQDDAPTIEDLMKTRFGDTRRIACFSRRNYTTTECKLLHQQNENLLREQDKKLEEMIDEMRLLVQEMIAKIEDSLPRQWRPTCMQITTRPWPSQIKMTKRQHQNPKRTDANDKRRRNHWFLIKSTTEENHTLLLPKKPKWLYPLPRAPSCKRTN